MMASGVAAQNTDSLSYHNSHQLSDTSYSVVKANGDSTIFLFEGGNSSGSNYRTMSVNADSTQVIWQGGSQPADTLEIWGSEVTADSGTTTGTGGGNYHLPYNGDSTNYLGGDTIYHHLPFTSLTTTGINSNATLINGVLNIPNYANNSWNFGGNNTGPTTYQLLGSTNYSPVLLAYNIQSGFFGRGNSAAYGYDCYRLDSSTYTFSDNTAMGNRALHSLSVGSANVNTNNTALGYNALGNATTGCGNVALGSWALSSASISGNNTFRGNVGVGTQSLFSLKNGIQTIAIGDSAFKNLSSGNYDVGLGAATAWNQSTLSSIAGYNNNVFYISDSTYHMHMKLDSVSSIAPNIIGKDGSGNWHVYQLPANSTQTFKQGSVPYGGSSGSLIQDTTGLVYDGNNLRVGHSGFYNTTSLTLNGGNGQFAASGWGISITASGGYPADASKSISFYNGSRPWLKLWMPDNGTPQAGVTPLEGMAYMHWYPAIADSFNLGQPAKEWNNAYVKNLYINGTLVQTPVSGTATLASGTVTVSTTLVKAGAKIFVSVNTPSGTQGFLSAPASSIVEGTSFVINSTSATETSTVNWQIINP
jgi:hypothetical protein